MNIEFHYYIIHFLANRAGFSQENAHIVACSSQFVDDNIIAYEIRRGDSSYRIYPTQNYGFWNRSYPATVFLPFHFIPGGRAGTGNRLDKASNPASCVADSTNAKDLFISALKTRNLYRVGIAVHAYADTWAHQNFSGYLEKWNELDPASVIPFIGHAQALKNPDAIDNVWEDPRLTVEQRTIRNRERFFKAARKIYKYFCVFTGRKFDDADEVMDWLGDIIGQPGREKTGQERILDLIIEDSMEKYNRMGWLREALETVPTTEEILFKGYDKILWARDELLYKSKLLTRRPVTAKPNFQRSHLFAWHEAAREHIREAHRIFGTLIKNRRAGSPATNVRE